MRAASNGFRVFLSGSGSGSGFRVQKFFNRVSGSGLTFRVRVPGSGFGFKNFQTGFRVRVPGSGSRLIL